MTRGRQWITPVLVLLVLGLAVGWWFATFERIDRWIDLPPRGEAAYNPLYALKVALKDDGVRVASRGRLHLDTVPLGPRDTLVLLGDLRAVTPDEARQLLAAVARGAHLVLPLPPYDHVHDRAPAKGPLLAQLPVHLASESLDCQHLVGGKHPSYEFCGGTAVLPDPTTVPLAEWHVEDGRYAFIRLAHGAGSVDLLSDLRFLTSDGLRDHPERQAFVRQLLAPNYGQGTVHLVYAVDMPSLWRLLLANGWRTLLPLALALLAWLWMRAQRFGPTLPAPAGTRRALVEHVQASGEHLHRYGRDGLLLHALRDAVFARMRRRDPLAAALTGDAQAEAVAARTGLTSDAVRAALRTVPPANANELRLRISQLIALRNRL
jgi:hypothetical protein